MTAKEKMIKDTKILFHICIPLLLVALGIVGAFVVFRSSPSAARAEPSRPVMIVNVIEARAERKYIKIQAPGSVIAAQKAVIFSEISGAIIEKNKNLQPGGRLESGEFLVRVDSRDYLLALDQERARVSVAQVELQTERNRLKVAEREWELLGNGKLTEKARQTSLALRGPQLRAARANLEAAKSQLKRARLNYSRTVLRAPWNSIVMDAQAERGQVVGPSTGIATLVGTDHVRVKVSIPLKNIIDLKIPGLGTTVGSRARVIQTHGDIQVSEWEGAVTGLEGQVEQETRTAQLLISVDNPFDVEEGQLPLLPGSFVTVELEGRPYEKVFSLPRSSLFDGVTIWIVNNDSRLERRQVRIGWGTQYKVYVISGIEEGDRIVTTPLSLPLAGEQVRVEEGEITSSNSYYAPQEGTLLDSSRRASK